jgi:hypothetical protein
MQVNPYNGTSNNLKSIVSLGCASILICVYRLATYKGCKICIVLSKQCLASENSHLINRTSICQSSARCHNMPVTHSFMHVHTYTRPRHTHSKSSLQHHLSGLCVLSEEFTPRTVHTRHHLSVIDSLSHVRPSAGRRKPIYYIGTCLFMLNVRVLVSYALALERHRYIHRYIDTYIVTAYG